MKNPFRSLAELAQRAASRPEPAPQPVNAASHDGIDPRATPEQAASIRDWEAAEQAEIEGLIPNEPEEATPDNPRLIRMGQWLARDGFTETRELIGAADLPDGRTEYYRGIETSVQGADGPTEWSLGYPTPKLAERYGVTSSEHGEWGAGGFPASGSALLAQLAGAARDLEAHPGWPSLIREVQNGIADVADNAEAAAILEQRGMFPDDLKGMSPGEIAEACEAASEQGAVATLNSRREPERAAERVQERERESSREMER